MNADMFQVSQKNQHGNLLLDVRAISVVLLENVMAGIELIKEFPEVSWTNPEHENMLVNMAFDSHVPNWDNKFLEGGWTKNGICTDRLKDLYMYYNMWLDIINSCKEIHDK